MENPVSQQLNSEDGTSVPAVEVPKQVKRFWSEWGKLGTWLLSQGQDLQFGNTLVEVKYKAGFPVVIIRTSSQNRVYGNNLSAKASVSKLLDDSETSSFEGALTYTVVYHEGNITRIILDEYGSNVLK